MRRRLRSTWTRVIASLTTTSTHCEQGRDEPNRKDLHTVNNGFGVANCFFLPDVSKL